MKTPKEALEEIYYLAEYKVNSELANGNILHLYPRKEFGAGHDGYVDAKFFDLWLFNTDKMEKRFYENHDALFNYDGAGKFLEARVFADGSFLIKFEEKIFLRDSQALFIGGKTE